VEGIRRADGVCFQIGVRAQFVVSVNSTRAFEK